MKSFHSRFLTFVHSGSKLLTIIILLFITQGCKKDKDDESPRVIIESPYENQTFSTVDTITVYAKITDNEQVKSVEISVLDTDFNELGVTQSYPASGSDYSFVTDFILNQPFLNSGQYYLTVRGKDGENTGSGYVKIQLTAVERTIENYLVVTKNETETHIFTGENQADWDLKGSYTMDLRGAALNYRQNIVGLAGGVVGNAVFYDTDKFEVIQIIPGFGGSSLPYFLGLDYSPKSERFYLMQRDPQIKILDKNALPVSSAQLINNFLPERTFAFNEEIYVLQKGLTSSAYILGRYAPSGLLLNSYAMSGQVREVSRKSDTQTFVWANSADGTTLFVLNNSDNLLANAYNRPNEPLTAAIEIGHGVFIICTSTGLYKFDYSNGGITVLNNALVNLTALYYDELNGIIYGTRGNSLYRISPTGELISSRQFSNSIAYFAINYNR